MAGNVGGQSEQNQPSTGVGQALGPKSVKYDVRADRMPIIGPYVKGSTPTLLEEVEAKKVEKFIMNMLYLTMGELRVGSPPEMRFRFDFSPEGNQFQMWIPTDLIYDNSPQLGGDLDVNRRRIISVGHDIWMHPHEAYGVMVVGHEGSGGQLKLARADGEKWVGFKAPSSVTGEILWQLPATDGSNDQVLTTDGNKVLSWTTKGGGGGGGVTSVATSSGTFINITGGDPSPITSTGTISGDLSATGTTDATTFLRGDNTWAVPAGTGSSPAGATYEVQIKAADGSFGAAGVFATTSGELQFGSASGSEAINLNAADSIIAFDNFPSGDFAQGIEFYYGYRIVESYPTSASKGLSIVKDFSGTDRCIVDFFASSPFVGGDLRTLSVGHSTHRLGGSFQSGTFLDVWGSLVLRGADPASDDGDFVSLYAQSGSDGYSIGLPTGNQIGTSYRTNMGIVMTSQAGGTGDTSWKSLLIGNENSQASEGVSGIYLKGYNAAATSDQTAAINNGDKIYFSAGGSGLSLDYTRTGLGSGASALHSFTFTGSGGGGGSGTVTSVATSSGSFVDITGGTITTSGTITGDLSASGTADSTTFLRGDNTWAVPAGGGGGGSGTVTSVSAGTGLDGGTITTSGTISLADTSVVAGSYTSTDLTIDAQGRITSATDGTGGGGSGMTSFTFSDGTSTFDVTDSDTVEVSSSDGFLTIDCSTTGYIDITEGGGGPPPPSDERLKENIQTVGGLLDKVEKLRPVEFDWNADAAATFNKRGHEIGLVAQEVEDIFPEIVGSRKGFSTVDYEKLVPVLVDCIKDLSSQVSDLRERISDLEMNQM